MQYGQRAGLPVLGIKPGKHDKSKYNLSQKAQDQTHERQKRKVTEGFLVINVGYSTMNKDGYIT